METTRGRGERAEAEAPWNGLLAPEWVPEGIDIEHAHPARIYDYLLGGKNNFAADREIAEEVMTVRPELREMARANRAFLGRTVRFAVESGVRQFLDIGTGIPTEGNTHEVAQALAPDCAVAYVDNDPMVLVHARALMAAGNQAGAPGRTSIVQGDLRDPRAILANPEVRAAVDLAQPVCLILCAILHFIGDKHKPAEIVATFRDALAPGSMLILSHGVYNPDQLDEVARFTRVYNKSAAEAHLRRPDEVVAFFDGFDLVEPGFVQVTEWRSEPGTTPLPPQAGFRGGVGILVTRSGGPPRAAVESNAVAPASTLDAPAEP